MKTCNFIIFSHYSNILFRSSFKSLYIFNKINNLRNYNTMKEKNNCLIETDELHSLIKNKKEYLLFDTSYYNLYPKSNEMDSDYDKIEKIKGSIPFDSRVTSNENPNFSFFFPEESEFFNYLKELLIKNQTIIGNSLENIPIIFYEKDEIFYAPRVWFMFKIFGFKNLKILNGGLNKWLCEKKEVIYEKKNNVQLKDNAKINKIKNIIEDHLKNNRDAIDNRKKNIYHYLDIKRLIESKKNKQMKNYILVDTRSNKTFSSLIQLNENKKVNNHIPFSINIPYSYFLNYHDENFKYVTFKNELEIKNIYDKYDLLNDEKIIISTCNKGVTACILLFLLHLLNKPFSKLILNQGSMVEYKYNEYNIK
ncbi:rhodanese like protein, putative [Plasmodium gallinaceum]|uniref:Rhodanese like protein, putative n=1 Tax=Plasmodium gallinaceum TaxID=5849 RepID=A0A1J1GU11_PLAGA|nr:rhodanese like protein, putative [Plasmodium gallinaceum]CRG95943.1 rhodanese like protein, putative [Plasmodium gallinaceum]